MCQGASVYKTDPMINLLTWAADADLKELPAVPWATLCSMDSVGSY